MLLLVMDKGKEADLKCWPKLLVYQWLVDEEKLISHTGQAFFPSSKKPYLWVKKINYSKNYISRKITASFTKISSLIVILIRT